ncbi:ABC transporter permease [Marinovum sp.]|uniref:ABC transporter permease n=1 Tax=Marinovum sp. TaxID=2024839 RepID=UPI002B27463C|nr:ABC transporter permease [Marinovum sp.]
MLRYTLWRLALMVPITVLISMIVFVIIQLPPGDFVTTMTARMSQQNESVDPAVLEALRARYGFDQPVYVQYWKWVSGILLHGDFGQSFDWNSPVDDLIWDRLGLTLIVSLATLLFIWLLAFPIGIYSAIRQYSLGDYIATFLGFIGLAIPNFLLALILMWLTTEYLGWSPGGLFSSEYINAEWSWARVGDLIDHLWIPVIVLGTGGTASLIRIMRANLLDELQKPYVEMARARGLSETRLLLKYPVRVALNPFVSTIGWLLPNLVSGAVVTAIVLSLPTSGPLLLNALFAQDMYLAGAIIMLLSILTLIGTLISDLLLAWLDPRVRYE